ncbi:MAG: hypothetical protein JSV52_08760 [Candidatus Zixiibacteriota bacterium]|nr:MAG: hypothetical protein JSV52_08760 [candidate division Zixibacteria bacterium]
MKTPISKIILYICTLAVIVGGVVFWMSGLELDPPMYFSGLGQSLSTDPAQYVYHARNSVLFGDSDPFDYPRWLVYQRSLTSLVAHVWFSIAGVSLRQANMVGILLSIGGLIFFILAVGKHHRPWVALVLACCYLMNVSLVVHGRLPYLENGLIFITAMLFFIYSWWGDRRWGLIVSGVLVAMAMMMGKLFGSLLLPALLMTEFFTHRKDRIRRIVVVLAAFISTVVVLIFVLYGSHLSAVYGYFGEQSYGLRGFPAGLSSPWAFVDHLISYGFANRLFFLDGDIYVFYWWGAILITTLFVTGVRLDRLPRPTVLAMFAVLCIIFGLMPLNYSPVRYALFLIPISIVFGFGLSDYMLSAKKRRPEKTGLARFILLALIVWQVLFQLIGVMFFVNETDSRIHLWFSLPAALAITYFIRYLIMRYRFAPGRKFLIGGIVTILFVSVNVNIQHLVMRVTASHNISIKEANADLKDILGENAVVSGPYGPVLTVDNKLKSFIHLFGVATVDTTLFQRYPITHLAVDSSNWLEAVKNYPALANMQPVTAYWVRDFGVKITDISRQFGNREAANYQPTAYERAANYYSAGFIDSAFGALREFLSEKPYNRSGNLLLADIYMIKRRFNEASNVLTSLAARHPEDYYTNLVCGRSLQIIGMVLKDNMKIALARRYYEKAVKNNPFKAHHAKNVYDWTFKQYNPGAAAPKTNP